jgi:DNA-binding MarR family transcriptional regulator
MNDDAFGRLSGMPPEYFEKMMTEFPRADESALRVFLGLRAASRRIDNAVSQWLEPHNLTLTKMDVLHLISASKDGTTVSQLRDHLLMTQPNVTFVVAGLERDGLVQRETDPADRRASIVRLTSGGRDLLATMSESQLAAIARGVEPLDPAERERFIVALARLTDSFEEARSPEY